MESKKYFKVNTLAEYSLKPLQEWEMKCVDSNLPFITVLPNPDGTFNVEWEKSRIYKSPKSILDNHRVAITKILQGLKKKYNTTAPANFTMITLPGLPEKDAEAAAIEIYETIATALKDIEPKPVS